MNEWISVKDRLPNEYKDVLTYNSKKDDIAIDYIIEMTDERSLWGRCSIDDEIQSNITHWMSLPKPPEVRE